MEWKSGTGKIIARGKISENTTPQIFIKLLQVAELYAKKTQNKKDRSQTVLNKPAFSFATLAWQHLPCQNRVLNIPLILVFAVK